MKIKNKETGTEADVPESLAKLLVNAGGWEESGDDTTVVKTVRKRAVKKTAEPVEG